MKAFLFPGQGCQKEGMGKDLYEKFPKARAIFEEANDILGERFSDTLFGASELLLMDTRYTQPAIFIYEVALAMAQEDVKPDCVGAVIGVPDEQVIEVLKRVGDEDGENLYIANYNGPGQLVVTGARLSIKKACKILKEMGAKRALVLPMKGVGHSPNSAEEGAILAEELKKLNFKTPQIPIYQDADGLPHTDPKEILDNQIKLMTYPVQWTNITMNMVKNGVSEFYEVGTDDTLQKIVKRMTPESEVSSLLHTPVYEGKIHDFSIINN